MRIYLQTRPSPDQHLRFLHLIVQKDLIEGWTLIKESGKQGAPGRVSRLHFDSEESAVQEMLSIRDKQLEKGYQVVFIQGQPSL